MTGGEIARVGYATETVSARSRSRLAALALMLADLGYTKLRWHRRAGGYFSAIDEQGIPVAIAVDLSPVVGGSPLPRLSDSRARRMRLICVTCLENDRRLGCVRADYIALPDVGTLSPRVTLTRRTGVAWAHAGEVWGDGR